MGTYGMIIVIVYDNGSMFSPKVLDLNYPTLASIPHSIANAFKKLVAIAVECDEFTFEKAEYTRLSLLIHLPSLLLLLLQVMLRQLKKKRRKKLRRKKLTWAVAWICSVVKTTKHCAV